MEDQSIPIASDPEFGGKSGACDRKKDKESTVRIADTSYWPQTPKRRGKRNIRRPISENESESRHQKKIIHPHQMSH